MADTSFPISFLLPLVSHAPFTSVDTPHRERAGQGDILLWLAIYSPCFVRGHTQAKQLATPRHGSTSLPKCGSDPLDLLLFSPCAFSSLLFVFSFSLPSLQPLVGASVGNIAYLAPSRVSMPGPAFRQGFPSFPKANMPAGRGGVFSTRQVGEGRREVETEGLRRSHLKTT